MTESEAELPAQRGEPVRAGRQGHAGMRSLLALAQQRFEALSASPVADWWRELGLLVSGWAQRACLRAFPSRASQWVRAGASNVPLLHRFALHLVVVLLAVGVVTVTQVRIPQIEFLLPTPTPGPAFGEHTVVSVPSSRGGGRLADDNVALLPAPVLHTTIPERQRTEVITYTVQPNDNLWAISQRFGLQVETLMWANAEVEKDPDLLSVEQVLVIPPVDGVYYTVQKGDTVEKLAKSFKTSADLIVSYPSNALQPPYTLVVGQKLMIPGGRKPIPPAQNLYPMTRVGSAPAGAPKGSGKLAWPTRGYLSQRYWSRHLGVDIANRIGEPVYAADAGYVVMAGRDTYGYGNQVVIDHGNGMWTRYAHLDKILVTAGDTVTKNQKIGTMGNTGRSTGPHLHFEVIVNHAQLNPLSYLP